MKASAPRARLIALAALLFIAASPFSAAQELNDAGRVFYGLLRARDLTFFSLLHLDMRPAHAIASAPGGWGVETSLAYQNTWAPEWR